MAEEEKKLYGETSEKFLRDYFENTAEGYSKFFQDPKDVLGTTVGTGATAYTLGNVTNYKPGNILGSATEAGLRNKGTANLRNPAYRNILGKGILRQASQAAVIPSIASVIAQDAANRKATAVTRDMEGMSDIEESQISDAGAMAAEGLRKLNLIEEQRSFDEGRPVFGGEEGITMGNLDEYFAANPDFSGIGDVQVPDSDYDQGGKFLPQLPENYDPNITTGAPALDLPGVTEGKVDYSSAFQGNQAGAEQTNSIDNSPLGIMTKILGNLPSSVTDDQRAEIAAGMLKPYLTTSQEDFNARNKEVFDKAAAEYKERYGERPDFMKATPDTPAGEMSMADYRTIARQKGFTGSGVNAAAKQLQIGAKSEASLADLNKRKTEAAIAKSQRPERERAPSAAEFDFGISQTMSNLQGLMDSGQELNPQQQATFDAGNAYLRMKSEFGESPFEQVDQTNVTPTYSDAEQKMIDKMKAKYPDRPEIEIIEALRADKRIA